uniref:Small ribosomal subunit protein bS6m n=1 Tax=Accipiter nisus TaxID=211598 RepID=A0A8B9N5H6_9AVES
MYLLTPVQGSAKVIPGELNPLTISFFLLLLGPDFEIGGNFPETAAVLKRTVEALMERGAIVRNLENLGERSLPYKISKHKERHRRGGRGDSRGAPFMKPFLDHLPGDGLVVSLPLLRTSSFSCEVGVVTAAIKAD